MGSTCLPGAGDLLAPPARTGAGGGGAAANAIMAGGIGRMSDAISGMMMIAPRTRVCTVIETGTVYHFLLPTLTDGSTMSPNMSLRGTDCLLWGSHHRPS